MVSKLEIANFPPHSPNRESLAATIADTKIDIADNGQTNKI